MTIKKFFQSISRFMFGFIAFIFISLGAATLKKGELHYENYWGGNVFALFAIAIGLLLLFIVVFKWNKMKN